MNLKEIYKKDSRGNMRVWWIETNDTGYRTHTGVIGGKIMVSGWQYSEPKNVGKANETTLVEQITNDVESKYIHQLHQGKYYETVEEAEASVPRFFAPMLAQKYDPKKQEYPTISQPKLDGIRCVANIDGLWTRQGKPIVSCPHIVNSLEPFFERFPDAHLDGELYNHELAHDFEKITSLVRKGKPKPEDIEECAALVQYHVYDCDMGYDAPTLERINFTFDNASPCTAVRCVPYTILKNEQMVNDQMGLYLQEGYEGQMLRDPDAFYDVNKRSKSLKKHKEFEDAEFKITDIVEGLGNWAGYAKSITIDLGDGNSQSSGMRGNQDFNKWVLENKNSLIGTEVTVRYQGKTSDNKMRFPVVVKFWEGDRDV